MSSTEVEESGGLVERAKADRAAKRNWFSRIVLFIQQVIAELKKVVTPTRKELINFTLVVIAFVLIMMALVWLLDQAFGFVTVFLFGTTLG
ncbi:preprotein translocase subunit SecE [Leucobacter chromiiresistens]|uniref:Protein translocase subunit SecE n=1 Tax=Leucobacter chromiiresistens TaxID=1079994 RepID=A0A147EGC5_9MICO|nr:preprotein translocase subunit SecE [Leucobacter chromiiresistens]KTR83422.1 preprotein translocase subunit SecE [Leucobacter chromiiresistens]SDQ06381.1 preprotein translocase subunit SecE [Leucobacter chromiiresistens]